ncbi:MAG TPA: hydrogenase maturation peptidase HycI [Anaerolineaceae bacterium]|nr:hydrogenase maturation peptidase HycI [Anaerolineaceae bacterium]
MSPNTWRERLKQSLSPRRPSERLAVVGIGSELNGDDAAGVLVVRALRAVLQGDADLLLIDAGPAPENFTGSLRRFGPDRVLLVDAADMGAEPGEVAYVPWQESEGFSASTHTLPISVFGEYIAGELGCEVALIGIQPAHLDFDRPVSAAVQAAVRAVAAEIVTIFGPNRR